MGIVTKTVGSAGGRDYSTLASAAASLPANLVTDGNSYVFNCFNDSAFTLSSGSPILTLAGHTTDATHTITFSTGSGQSFRDDASVRTNRLFFNGSTGVNITSDASSTQGTISITDSNVFLSNLQIQNTGYHGTGLNCDGSDNAVRIDNCIIVGTDIRGALMGNAFTTIRNSLLYTTVNSALWTIAGGQIIGHGFPSCYFCTIVVPSNATPPSAALVGSYTTGLLENCAIFGATAVKSGGTTFTFTTCMTDVASPPTGCTGGKTYTSQFQNTTIASGDWRQKAGANLQGAGTSDSTNGATDISGLSRPQGGNWDIGAWELAVAGKGGHSLGILGIGLIGLGKLLEDNPVVRRLPRL